MWIKINDHLLNADEFLAFHFEPGRALLTTKYGRRFEFSGEPAEALRLFATTLSPLDLGEMFKHAKSSADHAKEAEYTVEIQKQIAQARHETTSCPLRDMHGDLTILCPACGMPPGAAGKPASESSNLPRPLTTPNTPRGLKTPLKLT